MTQREKINAVEARAKRNLKSARLDRGWNMNEAAKLLGCTRKKLEDIETVRNYGCHLDYDFLLKAKKVYGISIDSLQD